MHGSRPSSLEFPKVVVNWETSLPSSSREIAIKTVIFFSAMGKTILGIFILWLSRENKIRSYLVQEGIKSPSKSSFYFYRRRNTKRFFFVFFYYFHSCLPWFIYSLFSQIFHSYKFHFGGKTENSCLPLLALLRNLWRQQLRRGISWKINKQTCQKAEELKLFLFVLCGFDLWFDDKMSKSIKIVIVWENRYAWQSLSEHPIANKISRRIFDRTGHVSGWTFIPQVK